MRFIKFEIRNFKGIKHAVIDLEPSGANIFTLIGLNESGKTTILEALSTFNVIKDDTSALYRNDTQTEPQNDTQTKPQNGEDLQSYVPKGRTSNFTDNIKVSAFVEIDEENRDKIIAKIKDEYKAVITPESFPKIVELRRMYKFENSDFKKKTNIMNLNFEATLQRSKKPKMIADAKSDLWQAVFSLISKAIPQITYFPTFLFNQPEKIILNPEASTETETKVNKLYREIIDNIAESLSTPLNVKTHIVERLCGDGSTTESVADTDIGMYGISNTKWEQVEASCNEISADLTKTIFNSWEDVFGGDFSNRKIKIVPNIDDKKIVSLRFFIEDGNTMYAVPERSLGFKWFFSFLLFTIYRASGSNNKPILFLFDEPASNLHAKAQMALLASFPIVIKDTHQIIYSTHSHYLINPGWLEQAFIVSNKAIDYEKNHEVDKFDSLSTCIEIEKYRTFVGQNPDRYTYFQPVLDKLDVIPSKLDIVKPSVLVEGKGDFFIIEYGRKVLLKLKSDSSFSVVPTRGAGGMSDLISLFMGWGVPFIICLDDDKAGEKNQIKYKDGWGLDENRILTLAQIHDDLKGKSIEGFLEKSDTDMIKEHFLIKQELSKRQIQLFFSENLAREKEFPFSSKFKERIKAFDDIIENKLKAIE